MDKDALGIRCEGAPLIAGLRAVGRWVVPALALLIGAAAVPPAQAGADRRARREMERIAKMWCQTIRASQIIPVYPLTEDLRPGDVFLVRATQQSETDEWEKRGFLPLDGHQTRLRDLRYGDVYFDGYWKDTYGKVPHDLDRRAGAGPVAAQPPSGAPGGPPGAGGTGGVGLTDLPAPRAAFPSYTFSTRSGAGLRLALPINGLPTALGFLRTTSLSGTVTIADAHTYAADTADLYGRLVTWSRAPGVQRLLKGALTAQGGAPVYLRVVSRVYLTGGLIVSLVRSSETRGSGSAGETPPGETSLSADEVKERQNLLSWLDQDAASAKAAAPGVQVRFVGASDSSVGIAESFDRPLVVGYLGFDVPVFEGPILGTPIPTWARIEQAAAVGPPPGPSDLSARERRTKVDEYALESMLQSDTCRALTMMEAITKRLDDPGLDDARAAIGTAVREAGAGERSPCPVTATTPSVKSAWLAYRSGIVEFVAIGGPYSPRHDEVWTAVDTAFFDTMSSNRTPTD